MFTSMFSQVAKGGCSTFLKASKKNFGKNEKAIKMRIKSVSSIEKITKAMKMVRYIEKLIFNKSNLKIFFEKIGGRQ